VIGQYKKIRLNEQLPLICKKRFVDRSSQELDPFGDGSPERIFMEHLSNSPTSVICCLVKRHKLQCDVV